MLERDMLERDMLERDMLKRMLERKNNKWFFEKITKALFTFRYPKY
jgi:hypothetical protein